MSQVRRVYVSGPMTGITDRNMPAFRAETQRLQNLGYEVRSPLDVADPSGLDPDAATLPTFQNTDTYLWFLRKDLELVLGCDAVQLLPGWELSAGAQKEVTVARWLGLEIWQPHLEEASHG